MLASWPAGQASLGSRPADSGAVEGRTLCDVLAMAVWHRRATAAAFAARPSAAEVGSAPTGTSGRRRPAG
ncbi:MAG TPA: hypothetical protein VMG12_45480 [Polyangiaceae bacterium]|nr:hypothetical protein [Polyangiaceae bacterium]